ncbi:DUF4870 domain-containing protein [Maribellus maritimus]|nr:DUF4870 domain-containing protein [Maribellus maritimus]
MINLSQFRFMFSSWIGIIVPMIIWINKKNKNVDSIGKAILNNQIS